MNELGLALHLYASEVANLFYCAETVFPRGEKNPLAQVRAVVFFRPEWRGRVPAYCFTVYQYLSATAHVEVVRSFDEVLAFLRTLGYTGFAGEEWTEVSEEQHYHL